MRGWMQLGTVLIAGVPAVAVAAGPTTPVTAPVSASVQLPARTVVGSDLRLKRMTSPANPALRLDSAQSMLRTGFGGSIVDLFPFQGGKFHLSGGGRLFGRAGRARSADPEQLRLLPASRAGGLRGRRFSPAMLIGYGRTVERGLAMGIDGGLVMGKLGATPDRLGQPNRRRLDSIDGRGQHMPINQIARVTALYRF